MLRSFAIVFPFHSHFLQTKGIEAPRNSHLARKFNKNFLLVVFLFYFSTWYPIKQNFLHSLGCLNPYGYLCISFYIFLSSLMLCIDDVVVKQLTRNYCMYFRYVPFPGVSIRIYHVPEKGERKKNTKKLARYLEYAIF